VTRSTLIVVHGAPASGKTELSRWLADELHLPLFSMDDIKDELFNHFDHQSIEQSEQIGGASLGVLWVWLESLMKAGTTSLIVETAFPGTESEPRLVRLARDHGYQLEQIFCHADEQTLRRRYIDRAHTPVRHPGHRDLERVEGQPIPTESSFRAMDLPGPLIDLDTSDLHSVRYEKVLKALDAIP
jgi:predicted kinase